MDNAQPVVHVQPEHWLISLIVVILYLQSLQHRGDDKKQQQDSIVERKYFQDTADIKILQKVLASFCDKKNIRDQKTG
jgi:hypothetical protein